MSIPKKTLSKSNESTAFQLHKSQYAFPQFLSKIIDYSEHKLKRYAVDIKDHQQKLVLAKLLEDYLVGKVAIAWKRGQPIWIKVSKD